MKNLLLFFAFIIFTLLELLWPNFLCFFSCKPDWLLVFAVSLTFYSDFKIALSFGILSGFVKDAFLPWNWPINTFCFALWIYLIWRLSRQISTEENYVRLALISAAAVLNNLAIGLQGIVLGNLTPAGIFMRNLIIISSYTTLISPLVFKLTKRITA